MARSGLWLTSFSVVLISLGLMIALGTPLCFAYSGTDLPDLGDGMDEDPVQVFHDSIVNSVAVLSDFMRQTQQGKNVSEMSVGLFVSKILGTLGSADQAIAGHIHANDHFTEGYLSEVFQNHPDAEIAFFNRLSLAAGTPHQFHLDLAVADSLECLKHIPDEKEAVVVQAKDRRDLTQAFDALKSQLTALEQETPPEQKKNP